MTAAAVIHPDWRHHDPRVIPDALPAHTCRALLDFFDAHDPRPRSYQGVVDPKLRQCSFVPVTDPALAGAVHRLTDTIADTYALPVAVVPEQSPLIYRYGPGVGFVTHHDEVTPVEVERAKRNGQPVVYGDITVTVSLTDPDAYDGGELYFLNPDVQFKLPTAAAVTFPATRGVLHGVRPITAGHRFSLLVRFNVNQ